MLLYCIIVLLSLHAVNCGRFCFSHHQSLFFCFCVWNISRTAEQICTKFAWKICLVSLLDEFEGQRSSSSLHCIFIV